MMPITLTLQRHWAAIAAAALIALVIQAPVIAFPFYADGAYHGINIPPFGTDEHGYLTRAKEALEGHGMGNPYLAEGKNIDVSSFSSFENILFTPLAELGLSERINVATFYNVAASFGIFALVLLLYFFMLRLSGDRLLSIGAALFVIGGHTIIETRSLLYSNFDIYGRSPFPWASSLVFFGYVFCLYEGIVRGRRALLLPAAILLGLSCYMYFYAWTFGFALAAALFFVYLASRDIRTAGWVALTAAGAAIVGGPVLLKLIAFAHSALGVQMSYYMWVVKSHAPVLSRIGLVTLGLFAVHRWRQPLERNAPFIFALILSGWMALNEQVVTGEVLQYGHYYWYFVIPISILVGAYLIYALLKGRYRVWFSAALICIALLNSAGSEYRAFFIHLPEKMHEQEFGPLLSALRSEPPGVVLTAEQDSYPLLVTIYTDRDIYWSPGALIYNVPQDRIKESLLVYLYLNKPSRADPIQYLRSHLAVGKIDGYVNLYQDIEGYRSGLDYFAYAARVSKNDSELSKVREQLLSELAAEYAQRFNSAKAVLDILHLRGVRYVLWDKTYDPDWDLSPLEPLRVLDSDGVILYTI